MRSNRRTKPKTELEIFIDNVKAAIKEYTDAHKNIGIKRQRNIDTIQYVLNDPIAKDESNVLALAIWLDSFLRSKTFYTGVTKRSALRKSLNLVIADKYPELLTEEREQFIVHTVNILTAENNNINREITRLNEFIRLKTSPGQTESEKVDANPTAELKEAHESVAGLTLVNDELRRDAVRGVQTIKELNQELDAKNQQLTQMNLKLQTSLEQAKELQELRTLYGKLEERMSKQKAKVEAIAESVEHSGIVGHTATGRDAEQTKAHEHEPVIPLSALSLSSSAPSSTSTLLPSSSVSTSSSATTPSTLPSSSSSSSAPSSPTVPTPGGFAPGIVNQPTLLHSSYAKVAGRKPPAAPEVPKTFFPSPSASHQ